MRRRRGAKEASEGETKTEFNPMYEFHEDVKIMLAINGNDTCDENYFFRLILYFLGMANTILMTAPGLLIELKQRTKTQIMKAVLHRLKNI